MHPKFHRFLILLRAFVKDGLIKNWLTKSSFFCFIIAVCGDLHVASSYEATKKRVL